ncbi:membrane protein [Arthrobacter phage Zeina]|nr:membrane protein [Arthrobacter phage Zeina]
MSTTIGFVAGVVTTIVAIPVGIVFVKPVRVGFTNGICKLASLGLRLAPPEEQRDFLNTVMDIAKDFEKENKNA